MMAMIGEIMRGKEPNVSVSLSKGVGTSWNARTVPANDNARQGSQTKTFVMTLL